jgi:hypothetical protein
MFIKIYTRDTLKNRGVTVKNTHRERIQL